MSTVFTQQQTINCRGQLLELDTPKVMGILNMTPDSFYLPEEKKVVAEKNLQKDKLLRQVEKMIEEGMDILDVGGVSTRPGADLLDEETELQRVLPAIQAISEQYPDLILSIDTFRAGVAEKAVQEGASIVNDVSAGRLDEQMFSTVAELGVPYVIMHMKGTPETMQESPAYEDVVREMMDYFLVRIEKLRQKGVHDIIVDPGFGFGKTVAHNYQLLRHLEDFTRLGVPVLAGMSRKSMINKVLETSPHQALNGTTVVHTIALLNGVDILRVHDVKEAREAIKIVNYYHDTV